MTSQSTRVAGNNDFGLQSRILSNPNLTVVPYKTLVETVSLLIWTDYRQPLQDLLCLRVRYVRVEYLLYLGRLNTRNYLDSHHVTDPR